VDHGRKRPGQANEAEGAAIVETMPLYFPGRTRIFAQKCCAVPIGFSAAWFTAARTTTALPALRSFLCSQIVQLAQPFKHIEFYRLVLVPIVPPTRSIMLS
jgi:hypothetical protein